MDQFIYVKTDERNKYSTKLRPSRLNEQSNPELIELIDIVDNSTKIYMVNSEDQFQKLTDQYSDQFRNGHICLLFNLEQNIINIYGWREESSEWVPVGGSSGGGGGGVSSDSSYISNFAKRLQVYKPGESYSKGEFVVYNNNIYSSVTSISPAPAIFNPNQWEVIGGDMKSNNWDTDSDGKVQSANHAETSNISIVSNETKRLQTWKPNTKYNIGEMFSYDGEIWEVTLDFTSTEIFDKTNLTPLTIKKHNTLLEIQGGVSNNEYYHLSKEKDDLLKLITIEDSLLSFNKKSMGDMLKSIYDKNNDGVIDISKTLEGMNATIDELNFLIGTEYNVQNQINNIKVGLIFKGVVLKYSELQDMLDLFDPISPVPPGEPGDLKTGYAYIVQNDETKDNQTTFYVFDVETEEWVYLGMFEINVRNFKTDPLDLRTEATGILKDANIDPLIARKTDIHSHPNKILLDSYTNTNADITNAVTLAHSHPNKSIIDGYSLTNTDLVKIQSESHIHLNANILKDFSLSADNKLLFKGSLIEGSAGGSTGSGGISDLSDFSTDDLKESSTRKYMTIQEKANLAIALSSLSSVETRLSATIAKIPASVTPSNPIATKNDILGVTGVKNFKELDDVIKPLKANAFVVVDPTGTKITYRDGLKDKLNSITDKNGTVFPDVEQIIFKSLEGKTITPGTIELQKLSMFSTDLVDMPKLFESNKLLVSNPNTMSYDLKSISEVTNSKANFSSEYLKEDWVLDHEGKYSRIVEHKLNSQNLIIAFYNKNKEFITDVNYKIIDDNQIVATCSRQLDGKVVVNCSQGTVGDGTSGSGGSGAAVTASTFLDDTRIRLDKTYSSQKIVDLMNTYAKSSNVYSRALADSTFAKKASEHLHNNQTILNNFTIDAFGNVCYNNKPLLTNVNSSLHQDSWINEEKTTLSLLINTLTIFTDNRLSSIMNTEFNIKNNILSVDEDNDNKIENQLRVVVTDGTITMLDVRIKPGDTQSYSLGISPNLKIAVEGKFDANYYMTAF